MLVLVSQGPVAPPPHWSTVQTPPWEGPCLFSPESRGFQWTAPFTKLKGRRRKFRGQRTANPGPRSGWTHRRKANTWNPKWSSARPHQIKVSWSSHRTARIKRDRCCTGTKCSSLASIACYLYVYIGSIWSVQQVHSGQKEPNVFSASPAFKKPDGRFKGSGDGVGRRRNASHDQQEAENGEFLSFAVEIFWMKILPLIVLSIHSVDFNVTVLTCATAAERKYKVEPMWSIDPALALSMYDSERRGDEVQSHDLTLFVLFIKLCLRSFCRIVRQISC